MDTALVPVVFVVGLLVVGLVAYLSWKAEQARIAELQAYAAQRGWTYTPRDDSWHRTFRGSPFTSGHNRQSKKVLTGRWDGRSCAVFDYVFHTTETSTNSQGHTTHREVAH